MYIPYIHTLCRGKLILIIFSLPFTFLFRPILPRWGSIFLQRSTRLTRSLLLDTLILSNNTVNTNSFRFIKFYNLMCKNNFLLSAAFKQAYMLLILYIYYWFLFLFEKQRPFRNDKKSFQIYMQTSSSFQGAIIDESSVIPYKLIYSNKHYWTELSGFHESPVVVVITRGPYWHQHLIHRRQARKSCP